MTKILFTGLIYTEVEVVLRLRGFDDVAFADIQFMESAALTVFAEVAD